MFFSKGQSIPKDASLMVSTRSSMNVKALEGDIGWMSVVFIKDLAFGLCIGDPMKQLSETVRTLGWRIPATVTSLAEGHCQS